MFGRIERQLSSLRTAGVGPATLGGIDLEEASAALQANCRNAAFAVIAPVWTYFRTRPSADRQERIKFIL